MNIDSLDGAGEFAAETGPAIRAMCDYRLVRLIHLDHVARTELGANTAADAGIPVYLSDHVKFSHKRN